MKVKHLFGSSVTPPRALYAAIVARARQPRLYAEMGVADDVQGRLDLLILHVSLALAVLKRRGRQDIAQPLVELFFADVEANFREIGASDQAVARQMRRLEEVYYGAASAYDAALEASSQALEQAVARNTGGGGEGAAQLAQYAQAEFERLREMTPERFETGEWRP